MTRREALDLSALNAHHLARPPTGLQAYANLRHRLPDDRPGRAAARAALGQMVWARLCRRPARRLVVCAPAGLGRRRSGAVARGPKPEELDDMLLFVALGVVLGGRLGFVLFYDLAALSRPAAGHPRDLAGRHVLPWRAARRGDGPLAVRPAARLSGAVACSISPPPWCRSGSSSGASPISSMPSSGGGRRRMCPGRWSSRMPGRCRAIRASSTRRCGEGLLLFILLALAGARGRLQAARPRRRRLRHGLCAWRASSASSSASPIRSSASCSAARSMRSAAASPWACCCRCRSSPAGLLAGAAGARDACRVSALKAELDPPDPRRGADPGLALHGALPRPSAPRLLHDARSLRRAGDFTTAPEISQMFGELIGLWAAQSLAGDGRAARASAWSSSGRDAAR